MGQCKSGYIRESERVVWDERQLTRPRVTLTGALAAQRNVSEERKKIVRRHELPCESILSVHPEPEPESDPVVTMVVESSPLVKHNRRDSNVSTPGLSFTTLTPDSPFRSRLRMSFSMQPPPEEVPVLNPTIMPAMPVHSMYTAHTTTIMHTPITLDLVAAPKLLRGACESV